jgi:hypothetical protein
MVMKINGKIKNGAIALMLILAAACGGGGSGGGAGTSPANGNGNGNGGTVDPEPNRNVNAIKLGEAEKFAILAYSSITSVPNSLVTGKIGLMPGARAAIAIDPSKEVAGGPSDMIGSDDDTVPINFLTNAKLDMISAYNESAIRKADVNKIGAFQGKIGGQTLPPGTYKWTGAVNMATNYKIQGSANDVWIFQIQGELNIAPNVKVELVGGALPQNIFWQVTGPVTLGANSYTVGTIIALPSITLKPQAVLKGRAFAKNGKVTLEQATVTRP